MRVKVCSSDIYDVYDRRNSLLNFTQKFSFFYIFFRMNVMMEMVREDNLTTYFGSTWSRARNKIADTSTERGCQSKRWHKRMETKRNFLNHFYHPRFASGYDQNQLIKPNISKEKKHRIVPRLMITVPKRSKRNNQRKLLSHFLKYWIRLTGWIITRPKVAIAVTIRNQEKAVGDKSFPKRCQKKESRTVGQLLLCLKPSYLFERS